MARTLSLTRNEQETAEDILFLLANEAAQRRRGAYPDDMPSRMAQICDSANWARHCTTVSARKSALALLVCQALEAMLRESEPGGAVLAALRAGKMEGSEST